LEKTEVVEAEGTLANTSWKLGTILRRCELPIGRAVMELFFMK
jgi:hypothetical protein